jgi:hypothetical protein
MTMKSMKAMKTSILHALHALHVLHVLHVLHGLIINVLTPFAGCYTHLEVGRNKPVRALSAGLVFPALRLPETPTLADAGWSYSGLHPSPNNGLETDLCIKVRFIRGQCVTSVNIKYFFIVDPDG